MRILLILLVMIPSSLSTSIRITPLNPPPQSYKVKVSMYTTSAGQTDSDPLMTASGYKLSATNPKAHRIIAVSRDLKRLLGFGTRVMVQGIGKWSGVYVIRDVMNARFTKKIDILINPTDKATSFHSATLTPIQE
jgi:3D (Asp-Asp-Asp) domain-containing protein